MDIETLREYYIRQTWIEQRDNDFLTIEDVIEQHEDIQEVSANSLCGCGFIC